MVDDPPIPETSLDDALEKLIDALQTELGYTLDQACIKAGEVSAFLDRQHPTPDREGLIEKLEAAKIGNNTPFDYRHGLDKAIAVVRQHQAAMGASGLQGSDPCGQPMPIDKASAEAPTNHDPSEIPFNIHTLQGCIVDELNKAENCKNTNFYRANKILDRILPYFATREPVMSNVEAVGTAQALMEGKAEKIDIAKPDESCAASDQPDDCRAAFVKWCWPELSGPDDVALITIFDGESYIEPFGTAWKAWQACWHSRPVRESRRDADIAIPISGWQPIVTAPKDGTVVLFYGNDGIGSIIQAQWQVNEADYVTGFYDANGFRGLVSGTHWMHLPESPTTRIEDGK